MKHPIIFVTIIFTTCIITYTMEQQTGKHRSLRDELLFIHTINERTLLLKDIQLFILQTIYSLKTHHSRLHALNFNILGEKAFIDFLYFTNEQENIFLKMNPGISTKDNCACITILTTDEHHYRTLLPKSIQEYPVYLIKPYDD